MDIGFNNYIAAILTWLRTSLQQYFQYREVTAVVFSLVYDS